MKLNLGSGGRHFDGFLSVDLYDDTAEVCADIREIELEPQSVEAAVCYHVIEHMPREDGVALVRKVSQWLQPGGTLAIETPDLQKCITLLRDRVKHRKRGVLRLIGGIGLLGDSIDDDEDYRAHHLWIRENVDRLCDLAERFHHVPLSHIPHRDKIGDGSHHLHVWTEAELRHEMEFAGFSVVSEWPTTHGRRAFRDMRLVGTR